MLDPDPSDRRAFPQLFKPFIQRKALGTVEVGDHQNSRRCKGELNVHSAHESKHSFKREAMIGMNILNRMTELGMPESVAVRS